MLVCISGTTALGYVVAVEADVKLADRDVRALELVDEGGDALGEPDATGLDADEHEAVNAAVALQNLVRDAYQRAPNLVRAQYAAFSRTTERAVVRHLGLLQQKNLLRWLARG